MPKDTKPLHFKLADQILKNAEARYLLAYGWVKDEIIFESGEEQRWTYKGTEFAKAAQRRQWTRIAQSHAVNAQKKALRTKGDLRFFPVKGVSDTED